MAIAKENPDVFDLTRQLVEIPSVSFEEQQVVSFIEKRLASLGWLELTRIGDNLVARSNHGKDLRVLLGGHTDTVPPQGNAKSFVEGDVLWGIGSADMKGGIASMLSLAENLPETAVDVTYVFYAREEVAHEHNGLLEINSSNPGLLDADLAILGEPTSGKIEAGCQGTMRFVMTIMGERAHTARPWMGRNAIHRMHNTLRAIDEYVTREPILEGCQYREALQVVKVEGGIAGNVVPDSASLTINHRVAPDRDLAKAENEIRSFLEPFMEEGDRLELVDAAPPAKPGLSNPLLVSMIENHDLEVKAKLGWTDVAFFDQRGIPAVNFGPGDATLAHTKNERVDKNSVEGCFKALKQMLTLGV